MDADFLKRTVGDPLSQALTSLVLTQPVDPIEFIGESLLDYVKRREEDDRRVKEAVRVEHLLRIIHSKQADENTAKLEVQAGVEAKRKLEEDIEATINTAGFHVEIYTKIIDLLKEKLGATGVELGRRVALEGSERVEYIAASEGREDMINQELMGLKEGEDPEDGATEEGVTFDVWKKTVMPPQAEPQLDEDGSPIPEDTEPELIPPEHILVENVMRNPRMKFFGIPKLGSYLAVPVTYQSWLQPGGITMLSKDDLSSASSGVNDGDAVEGAPGGNAPDRGAVDEGDGADTPKATPCPYRKNLSPMQLVLCIDTLGQGRCFSLSDIEWTKQWAAKLATAIEALEARMFDEEVLRLPVLCGPEAEESLSTVMAPEAEGATIAQALTSLADPSDEDKQRATRTAQYHQRVKAVESVEHLVKILGQLNLAPATGVLSVLEKALSLVGKPRTDICNARGALDWADKMRVIVGTDLVPAIVRFDPENPASALRAAEVKEGSEAVNAEDIKAINVPAWAILSWMIAAIRAAEEASAAATALKEENGGGDEG